MSREDAATIGVLHVRLKLPACTLKEKRAIVKSLVQRVRNRYNVSVAEIAALDIPEVAAIAIVCVSNTRSHSDAVLQEIATFVTEQRLDAEVLGIETELITA